MEKSLFTWHPNLEATEDCRNKSLGFGTSAFSCIWRQFILIEKLYFKCLKREKRNLLTVSLSNCIRGVVGGVNVTGGGGRVGKAGGSGLSSGAGIFSGVTGFNCGGPVAKIVFECT